MDRDMLAAQNVDQSRNIIPHNVDSQDLAGEDSTMREEAALQLDAGEMIDRLRKVFAVRTDAQLGEHIEASVTAISNWRTRNSPPYAVLASVAKAKGVSLDWLVFGVGEDVGGVCPSVGERPSLKTTQAGRITQFVEFWDRTRSGEEVIWLEQQIRRNVPEYRDWLPSDSITNE